MYPGGYGSPDADVDAAAPLGDGAVEAEPPVAISRTRTVIKAVASGVE